MPTEKDIGLGYLFILNKKLCITEDAIDDLMCAQSKEDQAQAWVSFKASMYDIERMSKPLLEGSNDILSRAATVDSIEDGSLNTFGRLLIESFGGMENIMGFINSMNNPSPNDVTPTP